MSLREWLILIGAVIVIGIILDGIRRMHRARKDSLEISRGMGADQLEESPLDSYNPELPSGGARIVDRLGVSAKQRARDDVRPLDTDYDLTADDVPEERFSADDLDDELPENFSLHAEAHDDADRAWSEEPEPQTPQKKPAAARQVPAPSDQGEIPTLKAATPTPRPESRASSSAAAPQRSRSERPAAPERSVSRQTAKARPAPKPAPERPSGKKPPAGANRPPAKEVFVINVESKSPEGFRGRDLKRLFEACGLEHGDMSIYHRHENDDTETPVQFSVANAVEPGTFTPATMDQLTTPAISFFMSLPGPTDSLQAYDFMIETAQCVVRNLGGELKDERRSVVTAQTIEHGRQRVREFERKRRSVKA